MRTRRFYGGIFLIAFATLGLEIALTRLLSVVAWYHLAFFAISTAMLGMTAGAVSVYLRPERYPKGDPSAGVASACIGFSIVTPLCLIALCLLPLGGAGTAVGVLELLGATVCCALPFYFSGIAVSAVLTQADLPIGKLYASDLIGASLACLAVLGALEVVGVPSLIILFGAIGGAAGYCFADRSHPQRRVAAWLPVLLTLLAVLNGVGRPGISPLFVKGAIEDRSVQMDVRWNSFSRVAVSEEVIAAPQMWGPSPRMPKQNPLPQHYMNIDGDAGTSIRRWSSLEDLSHLAWDVTNVAYQLRPRGGACVVGVGGGRDVQSALAFGHERVVGVEVNPIFIDVLQNELGDFAGVARDKRARLVVDEARSYLARSTERFSVVQMSLIDTWAATGAGAFSLSENTLYTVEAWKTILERLDGNGVFTVSRWYSPENLGETGRVASLAVATLFEMGVPEPRRHVAMLTAGRVATTLVSRSPFSAEDIERIHAVATRLGFGLPVVPDALPDDPMLRGIVSARSEAELHATIAAAPLNYEPPTDERPYFFQMLRLSRLPEAFAAKRGVVSGNLTATITLLSLVGCLALLTAATVIAPLIARKRRVPGKRATLRSGAAYFSFIGAGFMLVEIAFLQRLSVFLGHPVYALGVLLFGMIASAGCGSFLSERLPMAKLLRHLLPATMAAAILIASWAFPFLLPRFASSSMLVKAVVALALIIPLGTLMGVFFPFGMRLVQLRGGDDTPWYWALNGVFGVLCSAVAVLISMSFGISANLWIAAACYATLSPCMTAMSRASGRDLDLAALTPTDGLLRPRDSAAGISDIARTPVSPSATSPTGTP
jgi:hypothetical protein